MRQPILSPDKFADWFNSIVPGAYRKIDTADIRDMAECGLIGKYSYYGHQDIETVRAILLYEQLRDERKRKAILQELPKTCKRCGQLLPSQSDGMRRRPREYCDGCEPLRARERYRKWRLSNKVMAGCQR
ncbi:hypothetical protein ACFLWZ_07855 [Chloroflexota bacterium]